MPALPRSTNDDPRGLSTSPWLNTPNSSRARDAYKSYATLSRRRGGSRAATIRTAGAVASTASPCRLETEADGTSQTRASAATSTRAHLLVTVARVPLSETTGRGTIIARPAILAEEGVAKTQTTIASLIVRAARGANTLAPATAS